MAFVKQLDLDEVNMDNTMDPNMNQAAYDLTQQNNVTSFFSEFGGGGGVGDNPALGFSTSG